MQEFCFDNGRIAAMAGDKVIVVANKKAWDELHAEAKKSNKTVSAPRFPGSWSAH